MIALTVAKRAPDRPARLTHLFVQPVNERAESDVIDHGTGGWRWLPRTPKERTMALAGTGTQGGSAQCP
jgi:hypothetical protein